MRVALNKNTEVPLHDQLAEQIVFQIMTGRLSEGEQLPSVRALAQRLKIHHNTVSKAYADLVRRRWLSRRKGARLHVGEIVTRSDASLDSVIDQAIRQAQSMGFSIKELEARALERLAAAPPRYVLVVEEEAGLRRIIKAEIEAWSGLPVKTCTPKELVENPGLATDVYLVAVESVMGHLEMTKFKVRSQASLVFCPADDHLNEVRLLKEPSAVGVVSYSPRLLKAARGLLPAALSEQHSYREFLLPARGRVDFRAMDLVFCDSLAMKVVNSPKKRHYRLVAPEFVSKLTEWFFEPRVVDREVRSWKVARKEAGRED